MGGTASTRRVTFEADENENITVVKGIRLSENVIDRMKETSPSASKSQRYSGAYGASVSDEELKRRVAEELALEQAKKESENQKRLKQSSEVDQERAFANEQLTRAILRERISSEEERAKAKHLVSIKDLGELSCLPGHLRCWGEAEYFANFECLSNSCSLCLDFLDFCLFTSG